MLEQEFGQAYRREMEELGPSPQQLKEVMKRMNEELYHNPVRKHPVRRIRRTALVAAALCTLVTVAGAVGIAISQSQVHFFNNEQELLEAAEELGINGYTFYGGSDYDPNGLAKEQEQCWQDYAGGTLLEEREGTEQDGWTAMRAFQFYRSDTPYRAELYRAERLSDLNTLSTAPGWDVSWLEEHYTAIPGTCLYQTETNLDTNAPYYSSFIGGYEGDNGSSFTVEYSWSSLREQEEHRLELGDGVLYETADGVTVAISTVTTQSGQHQFWANVYSGQSVWSLHGAGLELHEIQALADHMNLSALCETNA